MRLLFFISALFFTGLLSAQMIVDTAFTPMQVVEKFMGEGVSIFNVRLSGHGSSIGLFSMDSVDFPMQEGIVLSTGRANIIAEQNRKSNTSTSLPIKSMGDIDLMRMVSKPVFNTTIIEFDFVPMYDSLFFDYIFASEEYPEYVGSPFNDVFCLVITGPNFPSPVNLARVGKPPFTVMVNNVNQKKNSTWFIPNFKWKPTAEIPYTIEFDGYTTLLTASCKVTRGKKHHLKIAIGNVNDFIYDSGVFLRANSFGSRGSTTNSFIFPFDFNSAEIKPVFEKTLDSLAKVLKSNPAWKLTVLGHTDSVGSEEYNDTLSFERANEVAKLLEKRGVNPRQIFVKGYAYNKPLRSNSSDEGRAMNRRVEIFVLIRE